MSNLTLPPRIIGSPKANLEIRIDLLKTTVENESRVKPKFIRIQWWGQSGKLSFLNNFWKSLKNYEMLIIAKNHY